MDKNQSDNREPQPLLLRIFKGIDLFRLIVTNLFFLFLLFLIYGVYTAFRSDPTPLSSGDVLTVSFSGLLVERSAVGDPLDAWGLAPEETTVVSDAVRALRLAADDDGISEAYLDFSNLYGGSLAQAEEIAAAVASFRASGKPVTVFSTLYSQIDLLTASYADEIYLDPMGTVSLNGFSHYEFFYGDFAEKFGVDFNVIKAGEWKGAAEAYSGNAMSAELKAQLSGYLSDLRSRYAEILEKNRGLENGAFGAYIRNYSQLLAESGGNGAQTAERFGWVDGLKTDRELWFEKGWIEKETESESDRWFYYTDYLLTKKRKPAEKKIAVLPITGPIHIDGTADGDASILVPLIDEAAGRSDVIALILRIDSGGGDVWASEEIRRAVTRFKNTGRPVVVSMAGTAASGAYWISTAADIIIADAFTVTGSIGVFGLSPTVNRFLSRYPGISVDGVQTDPSAAVYSPFLPQSEETASVRRLEMQAVYDRFLELTARSRGWTVEEAAAVAGGKVYTGFQAAQIGLVDEIGGFSQAVAAVLKKADWEGSAVGIEYLTHTLSFTEALWGRGGIPLSRLSAVRKEFFAALAIPVSGRPAALFHPVDTMEITEKKGASF